MKNLMDTLLGKRKPLIESLGTHGLSVEKKLAQKRVIDLGEGIVPDFDKDSEEEAIRKMNEYGGDKGEDIIGEEEEDTKRNMPSDEGPAPEDKEEEKDEEGLEKEYLGKKEDTYFYLVRAEDTNKDEEGTGALQVVDEEGKIIYSSDDSEEDSSDIFHFLVAAVRDIEPDDVSYDMFMKYVVPKIEELEKEDGDFTEEEEPSIKDEEPSTDEDEFNESIQEIKVTFDRREFNVQIVDEGSPGTAIAINGKQFNFSPDFVKLFADDSGSIAEDKLEELALSALSEMDKSEFDDLVVKGPEHSAHKDTRESIKESEDIAKDVKELQKSAEDAGKAGDFTGAAELYQRLAIVQQAIGDVSTGDEEVDLEVELDNAELDGDTPLPVDDEEVELDDAELDDEEKEVDDYQKKMDKDKEEEVDESKVDEKSAPMCSKCNKAHWPFHKCASAGDKKEEDTKEDDKKDDEKEDDDKDTTEGIVPDFDKDSEEEAIRKMNEMCGKCHKKSCTCKKGKKCPVKEEENMPPRTKHHKEF